MEVILLLIKVPSQSCLCMFLVLISLHVLSFFNKYFYYIRDYRIGPEKNGRTYISIASDTLLTTPLDGQRSSFKQRMVKDINH